MVTGFFVFRVRVFGPTAGYISFARPICLGQLKVSAFVAKQKITLFTGIYFMVNVTIFVRLIL
jgi:hypothetical protein